jgi:hypothetical protein
MEYIEKYSEYLVLLYLLKKNVEAYLAIKSNQEDYDITVILNNTSVKRVQVKSTDLQNNSKNNTIKGTEKPYDFLIIVVADNGSERIFVLTHEEAQRERGTDVQLSVSRSEAGTYYVKNNLLQYENSWGKIINA